MMQEQDRSSIAKVYKKALLKKEESDLRRSQNIPLEVIRRSTEIIHYFTDNGWRSAGLTVTMLTLAYVSTMIDGKIVTDVAAFAGGGLGGHSVFEFVEKMQDKGRKNQVIKKASEGELIGAKDIFQGFKYHGDIQPLDQMRKWITGYEPVGKLGERRAALLSSVYRAQKAHIDSKPIPSSEKERLNKEARLELLSDTVQATLGVQEKRGEEYVMWREVVKNLSFMVGGGLITLGAAIWVDNNFHNNLYTSLMSVADDIPTAAVIMISPAIEELSKWVSYPTLLKITNGVLKTKPNKKIESDSKEISVRT